jgi:hypothetical protein
VAFILDLARDLATLDALHGPALHQPPFAALRACAPTRFVVLSFMP